MAITRGSGLRALLDGVFGVRRLSGVAGILVLLAIALVLVVAAVVRNHNHDTSGVVGVPGLIAPPGLIVTQHAKVATSASTQPTPLLALSNARTLLFAQAGCHRNPQLEGSATGGQTWVKLPSPAAHLLRVQLTGGKTGLAIGADSSCSPSSYPSSGGTWGAAQPVGAVWFGSPNGVHTPGGTTATPCGSSHPEPIALAASGSRTAIVICRVGVFRTTTGGTQWGVTGDLPSGNPQSVALTTQGRGVMLLARSASCRGLRVAVTHNNGHTWGQGGCLTGVHHQAAVALIPSGVGVVTAGGKAEYYTTDGGNTWN